jgi:cold-inducible RNA-binding protein
MFLPIVSLIVANLSHRMSSPQVNTFACHLTTTLQLQSTMNKAKVFIGNLPFTVTSGDLEELFSPFGEIIGVNIREDRATRRPRGFAFVTFAEDVAAQESINSINGREYCGRVLTVNFATIRGSQTEEDESDQSWKTAPPKSKSKQNSSLPNKHSKSNHKKSWTEWASPNSEMK